MKRHTMMCCLLVGFLALTCKRAAEPTDVTFQSLAKGTWSGVKEPTDRVFKDQAELDAIWKTLSNVPDRTIPMPAIDFEKEMVIGSFAGFKPSSGYMTEIVSIQDTGDEIHVQVENSDPPPGVMTMHVVTYPYHIVKAKRFDKPVKFLHSVALGDVREAGDIEEGLQE